MKNQFLLSFSLVCVTLVMSYAQEILPSDRQGNWKIAGYSAAERFIPRDFDAVWDVTEHGIKGDGIINNSDLLASLIRSYSKSKLKSVVFVFPAGTYNFNSSITFNGINGIVLRGAGSEQTIFKFVCTVETGHLIDVSSSHDIGIENLKIVRENEAKQSSCNIMLYNCTSCWVYGVESSTPMMHHINIGGGSHIVVKGCYLHEADYYGDHGDGLYTHGYGVVINGSYCLVEDNICKHLRHGIAFSGGGSHNSVAGYNYVFDGNAMRMLGPFLNTYCDWGILFHGRSNNFNLFEGNVVDLLGADNGGEGKSHDNTYFRNLAFGTESACLFGYCYDEKIRFNSVPNLSLIGNVIINGNAIQEILDENCLNMLDVYGFLGSAKQMHTEHTMANDSGEWNNGSNDHEKKYLLSDVSYYYTPDQLAPCKKYELEPPMEFWNPSITWPPIGPRTDSEVPLTQTIPAKMRWDSCAKKTVDAPPIGSPQITLLKDQSESGSAGSYKINCTDVGTDWEQKIRYGKTICVEAIAPYGLVFLKWSDGSKENPRIITATGNISLYAVY